MDERYLSFEEQNELVKMSISGSDDATIALVNLCYPIACKIAKRYVVSNTDMQDLMQEAVYGILLAIPRYRPDKGTKFTTYCTFWMQKKMKQFADTNFIKYPEAKIEELKRYSNFIKDFMMENGREPTNEEIIVGMRISDDDLKIYKSYPMSYFVLDDVSDFLPSNDKDLADTVVLQVLLEDALEVLNENEKKVIIQHFGLFDSKRYTFKEIANHLGFSPEWARHLEITGLHKMKQYFSKINYQG